MLKKSMNVSSLCHVTEAVVAESSVFVKYFSVSKRKSLEINILFEGDQ